MPSFWAAFSLELPAITSSVRRATMGWCWPKRRRLAEMFGCNESYMDSCLADFRRLVPRAALVATAPPKLYNPSKPLTEAESALLELHMEEGCMQGAQQLAMGSQSQRRNCGRSSLERQKLVRADGEPSQLAVRAGPAADEGPTGASLSAPNVRVGAPPIAERCESAPGPLAEGQWSRPPASRSCSGLLRGSPVDLGSFALWSQLRDGLVVWLRRRTRPPIDVEDVVGETILRAVRSLGNCPCLPWQAVWAWARRTATNLVASAFRSAQTVGLAFRPDFDQSASGKISPLSPRAASMVATLWRVATPRQRVLLAMIENGDHSTQSIAGLLGVCTRTVERLRRDLAIRALRSWEEYPILSGASVTTRSDA
jgi:DNA-directed RNA polymerase specialized sigma24 family protein